MTFPFGGGGEMPELARPFDPLAVIELNARSSWHTVSDMPFDRYVTVSKKQLILLMFNKELFLVPRMIPALRTHLYHQKETVLVRTHTQTHFLIREHFFWNLTPSKHRHLCYIDQSANVLESVPAPKRKPLMRFEENAGLLIYRQMVYIRSIGPWRYVNVSITVLNIIHRPVFYLKRNVSETDLCSLCSWNLLSWAQ
jgi:hypothetical protein